MQGFRTILVAIFGPFVLWGAKVLAAKGFNLTPDQEQTLTEYLVGGGMTVAMIVMRFVTSTPVFKKVTAEFNTASTTTTPASTTTTSQSAGATPTVVKALVLLFTAGIVFSALSMSGCAQLTALEKKITSPNGQVVSQITVDLAVGAVVGSGSDAKSKAANIKAVAQKVLAADQGTTVALSALVAVANSQIATLKLSPAEQAGATLLVSTLSALAANALAPPAAGGTNAASTAVADVQVVVAQLLNDVITACGGYGV